jgi:hypothetical protein
MFENVYIKCKIYISAHNWADRTTLVLDGMGKAFCCINNAIHPSGLHSISKASDSTSVWDWLICSTS